MSETKIIDTEYLPVETPNKEIMQVVHEGDPETQLAILTKKAELAPRMREMINTILVTQTFSTDWTKFGDGDKARMCLSSAGAERIATLFDISYNSVKHYKEEYDDKHGKAFRYVFEGNATMGKREVFVQGNFSSRERLLGMKGGEYRPIEDIIDSHIRNAAYHIFLGNGVKALLGLRAMPVSEWNKIMQGAGADTAAATTVTHGSGTQGGTNSGDTPKQQELARICIDIANNGNFVSKSDDGKCTISDIPDELEKAEAIEVAKEICIIISGFHGKDGFKQGKPASQLKGKWLENSLKTARELEKVAF